MPLRKDRKKEEWIADKFMSLTEPTTTEKAIATFKGWPTVARVAVPLGLLLVLIGSVLFGLDRCGKFNFNRTMTKANANLANAFNGLANIQDQKAAKEKELEQIKQEEAAQKQVVIDAAKDAEIAAKNEANADNAANQAAQNVNAINAQNFNGTTLANAQRARCLAFPDSEGCK